MAGTELNLEGAAREELMRKEYWSVLDTLIRLNHLAREGGERLRRRNPFEFALEHCVVRCGAGRLMGSSSYVARRAEPGLDLVIVQSRQLRNQMKMYGCLAETVLADSVLRPMPRGYRNIYVDGAPHMKLLLDFIVSQTMSVDSTVPQTWILLG